MPFLKKRGPFESSRVLFLPVGDLAPNPHQPRTRFDPEGPGELAQSIREVGILQPLSVRRTPQGGYELISGERRLRAARLAGLREVPCILVRADDLSSSLLALVENLQRRDLDFWEEALALRQLIDQFHLSQEEAAQRVGMSQSAVANKLRLLKLTTGQLERLRRGGLTERHARALLRLPEASLRDKALDRILARGMTVAQAEHYIESLLPPAQPRRRPLILVKDVRLFLNTLTKSLDLMHHSGIQAQYGRQDTADAILLTIRIPRAQAQRQAGSGCAGMLCGPKDSAG